MKKRCVFIPADKNNMKYAEMFIKSLRKFHSEEELPVIIIDENKVKQLGDPHFWYRATPIIAKALLKKYDEVLKADADQLILGNLDHIWEGEFDVAVVRNSNPKEHKNYPIQLLDIHPYSYVNCGFVVMKSPVFVDHWLKLCMSNHFNNFQYREQDLLNIMVFYMGSQFGGPYKIKHLDDSDKWHGLVSKGYTPLTKMVDGKVILPKNDEWPTEDKQIVCYHWAGGNTPNKMNHKTIFPDDVSKYIDGLLK